ncbi:MAG: sel1 repeat family protein [Deltaproteobacteria bacterium]|nr:sel1 repeat family protein [Deltaproteobacteria bacterium]
MGKKFYIARPTNRQDVELTVTYFHRSASMGFAPAQRLLGVIYFEGSLVNQDYGKALYWLSLASDQGDPQAAYTLALMYAKGTGIDKDWSKAYELLSKSGVTNLTEAKELKKRLKDELFQLYPNLASALKKDELNLRMTLTSRQKRFIPMFLDSSRSDGGAQTEFESWLALNLGKISANDAYGNLTECLNKYYHDMTSLYPAGG